MDQTAALIFSKDRAMQLDCTLRSFLRHCRDPERTAIKVLYAASDELHQAQYRELARAYPAVELRREQDFKRDLLAMVRPYDHLLFLVDDNIFVGSFAFAEMLEALRAQPDALVFSLRLGENTRYCYMLNRPQALPAMRELGPGVRTYDWTAAEHDYGYPLEVSSSLFRARDMLPLLEQLEYGNPNTLEVRLDQCRALVRDGLPSLACYARSVTFCCPANKVQTVCRSNRAGCEQAYAPESLAELFARGYRIDVDALAGLVPDGCHQEVVLPFSYRRTRGARSGGKELTSIVVLNRDRLPALRQCIDSIRRSTRAECELIVVDNASTDGSLEYLRSLRDITLIENWTNVGCPPARAQAMAIARGAYLVLLDNDAIVTAGWLERFIAHAKANPGVGLLGPRSNYVSGPQLVRGTTYGTVAELEEFAARWAAQQQELLTPSTRLVGFCMFIAREVVDLIGCVDASFGPFGFEDDDYTWRACLAGFQPAIANDVFVHHIGGPQGAGDAVYNQLLLRAWQVFKRKWSLPEELDLFAPRDVAAVLSRPFDPRRHFIPLPHAARLPPQRRAARTSTASDHYAAT
jgi:GT2 family glycosyltransferase